MLRIGFIAIIGAALCLSSTYASEQVLILDLAVDRWSENLETVDADERVPEIAQLIGDRLIARGHSAVSFSTEILRAQSASGYLLAHPHLLTEVAGLVSARWVGFGKVRRVSAFEVWMQMHLVDTYNAQLIGRAEAVLASAAGNLRLTESAARLLADQIDSLMRDATDLRDQSVALCSGRARPDRNDQIRCERNWSPPGAYHPTLSH